MTGLDSFTSPFKKYAIVMHPAIEYGLITKRYLKPILDINVVTSGLIKQVGRKTVFHSISGRLWCASYKLESNSV